jgi:hypothetical protein
MAFGVENYNVKGKPWLKRQNVKGQSL